MKRGPLIFFSVAVWVFCGLSPTDLQAEIYKFQDASGQWVFSDQKPASGDVEQIAEPPAPENHAKLKVEVVVVSGERRLQATNPFYAPVQLRVQLENEQDEAKPQRLEVLVPAAGSLDLGALAPPRQRYRYSWTLGDPDSTPSPRQEYLFPIASAGRYRISQGFNGRFSHRGVASRYAVDVVAPVGSEVIAARAGRVISVKDDYALRGTTAYFLDKANKIKVLHNDGTIAAYVHLLMGSARVAPGDWVEKGDRLGRTGFAGYSTGPHLHFVIQRNAGLKTVSVPFRFINPAGDTVVPKVSMHFWGDGFWR